MGHPLLPSAVPTPGFQPGSKAKGSTRVGGSEGGLCTGEAILTRSELGSRTTIPRWQWGGRTCGSLRKLLAHPWPATRVATCLSGKSGKGKMLWLNHFILKITSLLGTGRVSFL